MAADLSIPLEELIVTKLAALGLKSDEDTAEFVKGIVEEESFEPEDRKSAIMGMLEADEEDEATAQAVDSLLEETSAYQEAAAAERRAAEEAKAPPPKASEEKAKKVLTPEEEEKRKADLLRARSFLLALSFRTTAYQYGVIEDETEADRLAREEAVRPPDKALMDPSKLSKKQRKKALDGVDLLALPNMNKTHVQQQERERRNADAGKSSPSCFRLVALHDCRSLILAAKAQAKREKDKADLKKQKEDAAKKLADKQKRAQKGERKA
ncbi:SPOSA6832_00065, partial [Sporobolomyces salmonicolor]